MTRKIIGILICTLMTIAAVVPAVGAAATSKSTTVQEKNTYPPVPTPLPRDGWALQWSHSYGGNGHSQLAQPVGDLDGDGVNEVIVGGYESSGICRILSYDTAQHTYVQEYSWTVPGGSYHAPTGATITDLDGDGQLELCVSWAYSGADGIYAYHWDGTTLTQLDYYHSTGVDFLFDCYACDYNNDGHTEIILANAPNMGTGPYHVSALGWVNNHFVWQAGWICPGGSSMECPIVWSGDVDNDGKTELIADVSNADTATAGTWALNWNSDTNSWDGVPVWTNYGGSTVYGDSVGDINGDGTPEIGIGSYGGTPQGWLFQWDGSAYQQVWTGQYPDGQPIIEAVAIGDADNDGHKEFCIGASHVHIIGWNGNAYYEKATLTDPTGMLAGMNVGDFDTDGKNEVKACEIIIGTGTEFIWKFTDTTPPTTVCTLAGDLNGTTYTSNVTVTLTATDTGSGVNYTTYQIDGGTWTTYHGPFVVSTDGAHSVHFYSVDNMGNQEAEKNTAFTIQLPAVFQITIKGGLGVSATIKNIGTQPQTIIPWNITLQGGTILIGKHKSGTFLQLDPNAEITEKLFVLGFGKPTISVTVGNAEMNTTGHVFLFFVWGVA